MHIIPGILEPSTGTVPGFHQPDRRDVLLFVKLSGVITLVLRAAQKREGNLHPDPCVPGLPREEHTR